MPRQRIPHPRRPVHQLPAAIGATIVQRLRAGRAKAAFEGTDERPRLIGGQVDPATLAIGPHLKHHAAAFATASQMRRSDEHTSELQSLMRISYAVFCLTQKTHIYTI